MDLGNSRVCRDPDDIVVRKFRTVCSDSMTVIFKNIKNPLYHALRIDFGKNFNGFKQEFALQYLYVHLYKK